MTPTKKNAGEFWWVKFRPDMEPTVVLIDDDVFLGDAEGKTTFWSYGLDMFRLVEDYPDFEWLGRVAPPEVKNAG